MKKPEDFDPATDTISRMVAAAHAEGEAAGFARCREAAAQRVHALLNDQKAFAEVCINGRDELLRHGAFVEALDAIRALKDKP